ncbi:DHH family phosphoesterase [Vibrio sp. SM6]|uniref:DHH family phosphoesterase n=1 Tax=Vibrio agarilyticus TaxID=2726741 RepID=A0A7X8YGS8_9VIBR|nr:DHH family phosphoesterase [Vibrio agarilyticus]
MHFDVFNGDADGITALLQLRLAEPKETRLITGVKRDIALLKRVESDIKMPHFAKENVSVTALDISMEKNIDALQYLLNEGVDVFYCDHHRTGSMPQSLHLSTLINLDPEICTSLLINAYLSGQYPLWAIVGAFGDNLWQRAETLANTLTLNSEEITYLKELGTLINYNGYGTTLGDLHIDPAELFRQLLEYVDPFALKHDLESPFYLLRAGYAKDIALARTQVPIFENDTCRVFKLPAKPWAKRISGVWSNQLANEAPHKAHAVLTLNDTHQDYTVSVRAPLDSRTGADIVCSQFYSGGGRAAAAGINTLPKTMMHLFIETLTDFYA